MDSKKIGIQRVESRFYKKRNIQRITGGEVTEVLDDLGKFMPQDVRKWINWERTRKEQGPVAKNNYGEYVVQA